MPAPVDTSIGNVPAQRFALVSRDGRCWSYPYSYVSLIECPSPEQIVIHCNCGAVKNITIRGRGLGEIVEHLTLHHGLTIAESEHIAFARKGDIVTEISISLADEQ